MSAESVAAFLEAHKREPSLTGKVPGEPQLARWLLNQRSRYRNAGTVSPEAESLLDAKGYPGLLRRNRRESRSAQMSRMLCAWIATHGSEPRPESVDPGEAYLGSFLKRKRDRGTCTPADQAVATAAGFPNIFDPRGGREDASSASALKFGLWVQDHRGLLPRLRSKDAEERQLASWLRGKRSASATVYESDRKLLESFGLQGLLPPGP